MVNPVAFIVEMESTSLEQIEVVEGFRIGLDFVELVVSPGTHPQ